MHSWDVTPEEALHIQAKLRNRVVLNREFTGLKTIAGADVAFDGDVAFAVMVLFEYPELKPIEESYSTTEVSFPYIPGLLSFREGPALIRSYEGLTRLPDLIIFDGQGIAHPRGLGLASHLGVLLDIPTIGCAKSRLVGKYAGPGRGRGSHTALELDGRVIGAVLRTRTGVKPVFVSPGHKIDLENAIKVVLDCGRGYRLPEPTRVAHLKVEAFKRRWLRTSMEEVLSG